jgi:hypothetical protein
MSCTKNNLGLVWIPLVEYFYLGKGIWKMSNWFPCSFTNVITSPMDEILQLLVWKPKINNLSHFVLLFTIDFNMWRQSKNISWDGGHVVVWCTIHINNLSFVLCVWKLISSLDVMCHLG